MSRVTGTGSGSRLGSGHRRRNLRQSSNLKEEDHVSEGHISAFTIAVPGTASAAIGTTAASAGGYGYGGNGYGNGGSNGGYQQPNRYNNNWQQHVDWCYDHYNTYNARNNTYQPYAGPRQQCYSPYYRG